MTRKEILERFKEKGYTYDPITGNIISHIGNIIKNIQNTNYIRLQIMIEKKVYKCLAHNLAWYLYYDEILESPYVIDHIDNNTINNKISNLRKVTQQQNCFNQTKTKGYSWNLIANKYQAKIRINGKLIHLGYFNDEQEAHQTYLNAKEIYHKIP